jgi:hypothetical protein
LLIGANNQKPLWQGEEMHMSNVNHGKVLLLEPPLSQPLYEMK